MTARPVSFGDRRPHFFREPGRYPPDHGDPANPYLVTESDNVSLNIGYDLGFATLRSITGYAHNKVRAPGRLCRASAFERLRPGADPLLYDQWSQEFQLVSQNSTPLAWLLGANYFNSDGPITFYTMIPLVNPLPLNNDTRQLRKETAYALFGQATLQLNEHWSITGGLRLSHEKDRESDPGHRNPGQPGTDDRQRRLEQHVLAPGPGVRQTADNLCYMPAFLPVTRAAG